MASVEAPGFCSTIWRPSAIKPAFEISENRKRSSGSAQILVLHRIARRRRGRLFLHLFSSPLFSSSHINFLSGSGRGITMGVGRRGRPMNTAEDEEQEGRGYGGEREEVDPKDIVGGREDACELEKGSRGIVSTIEEALPTKDLVTLASCVVGLLTGVAVVLFNQIFLGA